MNPRTRRLRRHRRTALAEARTDEELKLAWQRRLRAVALPFAEAARIDVPAGARWTFQWKGVAGPAWDVLLVLHAWGADPDGVEVLSLTVTSEGQRVELLTSEASSLPHHMIGPFMLTEPLQDLDLVLRNPGTAPVSLGLALRGTRARADVPSRSAEKRKRKAVASLARIPLFPWLRPWLSRAS